MSVTIPASSLSGGEKRPSKKANGSVVLGDVTHVVIGQYLGQKLPAGLLSLTRDKLG